MPWQRPEQALVVRSTHPTSLLWGLHCEEQQGAGGHDESPGQQSAAGEVKNVANVVANARSAGESSAAEEHFFTSRLQPPTDDMKLHHLLNHPQAVLFISLRSFFTHRPLKCFGVGVLAEWKFFIKRCSKRRSWLIWNWLWTICDVPQNEQSGGVIEKESGRCYIIMDDLRIDETSKFKCLKSLQLNVIAQKIMWWWNRTRSWWHHFWMTP